MPDPENLELNKPRMRAFLVIAQKQSELFERTINLLRDLNKTQSILSLSAIKQIELRVRNLKTEILDLELKFDQPDKYFIEFHDLESSYSNPSEALPFKFALIQDLQVGQLADRRTRITRLLEGAEKEISDKKNAIMAARVTLIGIVALLVSIASMALSVLPAI